MLEINWNPQEITNPHFLPFYENKSRYLVFYGGAGSGKSHFIAQKHLLRIILSIQRGYQEKFLFLRRVKRTCRHSVFSLFKRYVQQANLTKYCQINKTDTSFHFVNGSEVLCEGLDNPEKLKSIERVTSLWVEEATELDHDSNIQIDLRLRGEDIPAYAQICYSFNPITKLNWAYKEFFERENPNILTIDHSTYKDNQHLDDNYIQVLNRLKERDEIFYKIYALGEWGVLGNLVYTNWIVKKISQNPLDYDTVRCGLDFGFNNPSAFIKIGLKDDDIYVFNEFYQDRLTNNELIRELKITQAPDKEPILLKQDYVIADSAEPDRIREFKQAGYNVKASKKGKESVRRGIEWVRRRKIYIHPSCINTQNEISMYKYKDKKDTDKDEYEEPLDFKNHLMDALRYAVEDYVLYEKHDMESLGIAIA